MCVCLELSALYRDIKICEENDLHPLGQGGPSDGGQDGWRHQHIYLHHPPSKQRLWCLKALTLTGNPITEGHWTGYSTSVSQPGKKHEKLPFGCDSDGFSTDVSEQCK
jgi:hypothetical protein